MKNCNYFLRAGFGLLLLSLSVTGVFAQGRVNLYTTQTSFSGAGVWNDLSTSGGTNIYNNVLRYFNTPVTTTLPFDFNFDNTTESASSTLEVGPGWLSFGSTPQSQQYGGLGSKSYPGVMYFWGGAYNLAGSGDQNFPGVDASAYYGIYTELDGVEPNRVFTIQWTGMHSGFSTGYARQGNGTDASNLCSMQVKLYETSGVIQFIYQNHSQNMGGYAMYGAFYSSAIGLNGFTSPSFTSLTYEKTIDNTPSTDLQFSPPQPPPQLSLQPKSLNFGSVIKSDSATMCVTASSVGANPLTILGYSLSGSSDFSIASGPPVGTVIAVGNSVQYCITFGPSYSAARSGVFTLVTNGNDSGSQQVNLSGNGLAPLIQFGTTTLFHRTFVPLRHTSDAHYITFTNSGTGPLVVNSAYPIGPNADNYFVSSVPSAPTPPGGSDSIGVRFAPNFEGRPDAAIVINTNAVNNPSDTITMFGVGTLRRLVIDSSYSNSVVVNFDSVNVGVTSCKTIQLNNPGADTLAITKNFFSSAAYDFTLTPLTGTDTLIAPGATKAIQVCFRPLQPGYRTATLRVVTNIPLTFDSPPLDTSQFTVQFIGTGVPFGHFVITGPATTDTVGVTKTQCVTDTFWNTGSADLTVTSVTVAGSNASEFAGTYPALPFTLAAGTHRTFTVCATPKGMGDRLAMLTGVALSGEKPDTAFLALDVFGQSVADTVAIATGLPALSCIPSVDTLTISVTNTGNVATSYMGSISGLPFGPDFKIVSANPSSVEAAGGVATFTVTFTPTTNGIESAMFNITGGAGGSVAITGTGGAASIAGTGTAPATQVGLTSNFTAVVCNSGTCDWTPGAAAVGDPFTYTGGGTTMIPPGGCDTLNFTFAPSALGTFTQPVTFPSAAGVSLPAAAVTVTGTTSSASVPAVSALNGYSLDQNYPNPFSHLSEIAMTLPSAGVVQLTLLDIKGEVVRTMLNQHMNAGTFQVTLDASELASGTYYYRMVAGDVTLTRQMMIVK